MRINHDYRTALKGGKRISKYEQAFLKKEIKENTEAGMIAGTCFALIIVFSALIMVLGVIK